MIANENGNNTPAKTDDNNVKADINQSEALRLATLLHKATPDLIAEYRVLIRHTGGFLSSSMSYAYAKGLSDALKLITKEIK